MVKKVDIIASIGAQDRTGNAFRQVDRNINKLRTGSDRTARAVSGNFGMMRGASTQFGYQIQDIAVQLQSGQNAMLVFGQQGSQIASIFGPGGAVIGAFLAVGAALGTALLPKLFGAEKALGDVDKQLANVRETMKLTADGTGVLTGEFEELIGVSEELARKALLQSYNSALIAVTQSQRDLTDATEDFWKDYAIFFTAQPIKDLQDQFDITREKALLLYSAAEQMSRGDFNAGADKMRETLISLIDPVSGANVEFRVMAGELLGLLDKYDQASDSASKLDEMLRTLSSGGDLVTESGIEQANSIDQQVDALRREADQLGMTARAKVIYNAVQDGASPAQLEEITRIYDKITAYEAEQKAIQDALRAKEEIAESDRKLRVALAQDRAKELADFKRLQEEKKQAELLAIEARYQAGAKLAGAMSDLFKEGSKEQRAALAIQKGLALGEAVMNMHRAISSANAVPFPANIAAIAQASATGLSAIAGIRSVSFEGGGFTGTGARVGGLDGKGGFPAIVHPNETIIDHEKGGGAGVNVNFHISAVDSEGVKDMLMKQRGTIIGMVRQATNERGRRSAV